VCVPMCVFKWVGVRAYVCVMEWAGMCVIEWAGLCVHGFVFVFVCMFVCRKNMAYGTAPS
jgi:hypothetical protein